MIIFNTDQFISPQQLINHKPQKPLSYTTTHFILIKLISYCIMIDSLNLIKLCGALQCTNILTSLYSLREGKDELSNVLTEWTLSVVPLVLVLLAHMLSCEALLLMTCLVPLSSSSLLLSPFILVFNNKSFCSACSFTARDDWVLFCCINSLIIQHNITVWINDKPTTNIRTYKITYTINN